MNGGRYSKRNRYSKLEKKVGSRGPFNSGASLREELLLELTRAQKRKCEGK